MVNKWYQNIVPSLTALGEVSEDDGVLRGRESEDHSAHTAMVAVASLEPVLKMNTIFKIKDKILF